jgi:hypothetical protein
MAPLNERQKKAQRLAAELGRCSGTWVITPLPLDDSARALRFQVLESERDAVISELCGANWIPAFVQNHPRFTPGGLKPAYLYEIVIEKERQPVPDSPRVSGELAKREKTPAEVQHMRRYLGWSK